MAKVTKKKSQRANDISLRLKESTNIKNIALKRFTVRFGVDTLDTIIDFLLGDCRLKTQKALKNIYKLFTYMNDEPYTENTDLETRFYIIKNILRLMLDERFESISAIKSELIDSSNKPLVKEYFKIRKEFKIDHWSAKNLLSKLDDRLEFGYVITVKELFQEFFEAIDDDEYDNYKDIADDMNELALALVNMRRGINSLGGDEIFTLETDKFEDIIRLSVERLQDRMKIFKTGITGLNVFLAPGYMSKRLYIYLAFPGGGKSQVLLKSALDIKKYNNHVRSKDPDKNPSVLYITMENSIEETVERIFNMEVSPDDIRNFTPDQVIQKLKKGGHLSLTDENNINIIILYYPNRSISTNDLYGIIEDLSDDGNEVIALILDYIKRIAPAEKAPSEKEELKNISNELKSLAIYYDIPVITAQQLNRLSASVVDTALQANKEDVAKLIGRDGVAGAWEILENADWCCVLNQEVKKDSNELFMTFKLLKRRYRSSDDNEYLRNLNYFNQPYETGNDIKLLDDLSLPKPLMVLSMNSEMMAYEDVKRGKKSSNSIEETKKKLKYMTEFDPFDEDKTIQYV